MRQAYCRQHQRQYRSALNGRRPRPAAIWENVAIYQVIGADDVDEVRGGYRREFQRGVFG
ncbi:hypothetical protein LX83_007314 [Goodfellowiella coeruleoviolacea]|uniref:Uncharacterized protein n=1 Tax=Goodfellowiella coeruleoviolacea TaxID=334858 RepID=A0AAE3KPZ9_9PSEU|nr:hypothetical protein [Goodfellowiella coeruleoviolacea]